MARDTIGSQGLEQGGPNLGNDYSRPITTEKNEQNSTTNVGSSSSEGNENANNDNEQNSDNEDGDESGSMPDPETLKDNES